MTKELYVTGVVIPNGLPDAQNDILTKKDIKIIFTKYLEHDTDTMHSYLKNEGVHLLANWISEIPMEFGDKTAPAGSWLATFKITNIEIINSILDGDIGGLSLGSVPSFADTQKFWFITKPMSNKKIKRFQDVDIEEVKPRFISFVDKPSNGFGLEIDNYELYINKRDDTMDKETKNEIPVEEEKLSVSAWERIMGKFSINKATDVEEHPAQEVKPPAQKEEVKDISNNELLEKIPEAVATGIVSAFEKMNAETKPETKPPEETETKPEGEKEKETETEQETKTDDVKIDKRATTKEEGSTDGDIPTSSVNFYKKSGRDMFGRRIRNP